MTNNDDQQPRRTMMADGQGRRRRTKMTDEERREKKRARMKAWNEANKEKVKAYRKAWNEANKEKLNAYKKAYNEANKEKIKACKKAYNEANKEKLNAYRKAWKKANKARLSIPGLFCETKGRAKKKGMDFNLTIEWLQARIKKSRNTCEATGYPFNYTFKIKRHRPYVPSIHRINPNKGYTKDNCAIVCWAWNRAIGDSPNGVMSTLIKSKEEKDKNDANQRTINTREDQGKLWGQAG